MRRDAGSTPGITKRFVSRSGPGRIPSGLRGAGRGLCRSLALVAGVLASSQVPAATPDAGLRQVEVEGARHCVRTAEAARACFHRGAVGSAAFDQVLGGAGYELIIDTRQIDVGTGIVGGDTVADFVALRLDAVGTGLEVVVNATLVFADALARIERIVVIGSDDDDTLLVDDANGLVNRAIDFDGAGQQTASGDALAIRVNPGTRVARETYLVGAARDAGTWVLDPNDSAGPLAGVSVGLPGGAYDADQLRIRFTGLETVDTATPAAILDVALSADPDRVRIEDGGDLMGVPSARLVDAGNTFETFRFANKETVRVLGLGGADRFEVDLGVAAHGLVALELYGHDATGTDGNDDEAADSFTLRATAAAYSTAVHGGGGNDTVNLGSAGNDLSGLLGELNVDGGGHRKTPVMTESVNAGGKTVTVTQPVGDTLNLDDRGHGEKARYTVGATTFDRDGAVARVKVISAIESVTLNTGSAASDIHVGATADAGILTLVSQGGDDDIHVAATGSASILRAHAGGGADTLALTSTGVGSMSQIDAGDGDDSLTLDPGRPGSGVLLAGQAGSDSFAVGGLPDAGCVLVLGGDPASSPGDVLNYSGPPAEVQVTAPGGGSVRPVPDQVLEFREVEAVGGPGLVFDFGDAPDTGDHHFPTSLAADGARHGGAGAALRLGALWDADADGRADASALGDDGDGLADEDGVSFSGPLVAGRPGRVEVEVTGAASSGLLDAWVDFNQDGDWNDAGEQILVSRPVVSGANSLVFAIPADALSGSPVFARFRLSTTGGLAPTGLAVDGEVEDHALRIERAADLAINNTDALDPVAAGTLLTYTLTVVNGGPSIAESVEIVDTIPAGTRYVGATAGCIPSSAGSLVCSLGTVPAGDLASVDITVAVAAGVAGGSVLVNSAEVASMTSDPELANNAGNEDTTVTAAAGREGSEGSGPVSVPVPISSTVAETTTATAAVSADPPAVSDPDTGIAEPGGEAQARCPDGTEGAPDCLPRSPPADEPAASAGAAPSYGGLPPAASAAHASAVCADGSDASAGCELDAELDTEPDTEFDAELADETAEDSASSSELSAPTSDSVIVTPAAAVPATLAAAKPGSVLIYPLFDINDGSGSRNATTSTMKLSNLGPSSINIHLVRVCGGVKSFGGEGLCQASDRTLVLTSGETAVRDVARFFRIDRALCPSGFIVAFAVDADGVPIVWDRLIGSMHMNATGALNKRSAGLRAIAVQSAGGQTEGDPVTGALGGVSPVLPFDGVGYRAMPDRLYSDFLATAGTRHSELVLMTLGVRAGRQNPATSVTLDWWNQAAVAFSGALEYVCHAYVRLDDEVNTAQPGAGVQGGGGFRAVDLGSTYGTLSAAASGAPAVLGAILELGLNRFTARPLLPLGGGAKTATFIGR